MYSCVFEKNFFSNWTLLDKCINICRQFNKVQGILTHEHIHTQTNYFKLRTGFGFVRN